MSMFFSDARLLRRSVFGYARSCRHCCESQSGPSFHANMSPICAMRRPGNTITLSPLVCAAPK